MAKCKLCKTNIPDGTEYCKDCLDKENEKANESYLDSLLNSVKNTTPATDKIYKKKADSNLKTEDVTQEISPKAESDDDNDDMFKFDFDDIEDFDQFNFDDDLEQLSNDDIISNQDLFGEDIAENKAETVYNALKTDPTEQSDKVTVVDIPKEEEKSNNIISDEMSDFPEEEGLDSDLNELLNQLNSNSFNVDDTIAEEKFPESNIKIQADNAKAISENDIAQLPNEDAFEEEIENEDDFLSLLNQISSDDPVVDDVKAISDLMKGGPVNLSKGSGMPSDVGEVFSDALKAVSGLNDPNLNEDELLKKIPDKKGKKAKKDKKKKASKKKTVDETGDQPKKSLLQRLFGNVKDETTAKKSAAGKKAVALEGTDVGEAPKKAKPKKGKKGKGADEEESSDTNKKGKARAADAEDAEDVKDKKKAKKEKKQKKQKSDSIIQVIDEIDEDVGRINRLGATIVFVFFALLALLIIVGTNAVSYTLSIQHATSYFDKQKYTNAYYEVYGMKIEDNDKELYSKIMTVMFVNKQLNSYNNYCALKEYPQALDSLLKGLKRYDKYIELASLMGIKTDMDYVRKQILAELKDEFNLSEKDALKINNIEDMKEYSLKIYDVALENQ